MIGASHIAGERRIAVVTMVYNEPAFLPLWALHYRRAVGEAACYVIDHGSTDGSTANLGEINVVRIPRSPMHDQKRARFLSDFCSSLLEWYDGVIYTDVDEFLVADPERWPTLADYLSRFDAVSINCLGFDVFDVNDAALDSLTPALQQRRWARFSLAMCKPLLTTSKTIWQPGFHSSNHEMAFGDLLLFHLHYFDRGLALARQSKTRSMPWGDGPPDHYQRWSDDKISRMFDAVKALPRVINCTFKSSDEYLSPILSSTLEVWSKGDSARHRFYFGQIEVPDRLYEIPQRFSNSILMVPCSEPGEKSLGSTIRMSCDECYEEIKEPDRSTVVGMKRSYAFVGPNPDDHIQKFHRSGKFYERNVLDRLANVIPSSSIILDIGANIGNHTVYFSGELDASRVFPFEPNPKLNEILRENIRLNALANVDLAFSSCALGRLKSTVRLVVTDVTNWGNGHLTLSPEQGGPMNVPFEAMVEVRPLDSIEFDRVDFIKIDVEGHELEVLRGGLETIKRHHPVIFVEVNRARSAQLCKLMREIGYDIIDYYCSYLRQLNYLLIPTG